MQKFDLSMELFPLVVNRVDDALTDEDHVALFRAWETVFARKERYVALIDLRLAKTMPSAKERATIANWSRTIDPLTAEYSLGSAYVIQSPVVRGTLTAIWWLHKPSSPMANFGTMLEACDWCLDRLRLAGIPHTPSIMAYRSKLARHSA